MTTLLNELKKSIEKINVDFSVDNLKENLGDFLPYNAINWNQNDEISVEANEYWDLNVSQFWVEKEIDLSFDVLPFESKMSKAEQLAFILNLGGLTLLDTRQSFAGMPALLRHEKNQAVAAVMTFMSAMESIHAKSYSAIFSTLCSNDEIEAIFEWVRNNKNLQYKAKRIDDVYQVMFESPEVSDIDRYKAMVASVLLETFLFYSGFFYPLYLAGQGRMIHSSEIINLIIRDESIHGQFIGIQAQRLFETFDSEVQKELEEWANNLLFDLFQNEVEYVNDIYEPIGLQDEVIDFVKYNANKAFDNLGLDHAFEEVEINPVVEMGLSTETKNHDFFSSKGNGYVKALNVTPVTDETFNIDRLNYSLDDLIDGVA